MQKVYVLKRKLNQNLHEPKPFNLKPELTHKAGRASIKVRRCLIVSP